MKLVMMGNGKVTDNFLKVIQEDDRFELVGLLMDRSFPTHSDYYNTISQSIPVIDYDTIKKLTLMYSSQLNTEN